MINDALSNLTSSLIFRGCYENKESLPENPSVGSICRASDTGDLYISSGNAWITITDDTGTLSCNSHIEPKRFNCKKCGAPGQTDVCVYCGSTPD